MSGRLWILFGRLLSDRLSLVSVAVVSTSKSSSFLVVSFDFIPFLSESVSVEISKCDVIFNS